MLSWITSLSTNDEQIGNRHRDMCPIFVTITILLISSSRSCAATAAAVQCLLDLTRYSERLTRFDSGTFPTVPGGLVVRIRRSHRRGRGSIPRLGSYVLHNWHQRAAGVWEGEFGPKSCRWQYRIRQYNNKVNNYIRVHTYLS